MSIDLRRRFRFRSRFRFRFSFMTRSLVLFVTVLISLASSLQSSQAISSLSELKIPEEEISAIQNRQIKVAGALTPLIDRATFAREEFLRLRSENNATGAEFQAASNFFRSQIRAMYRALVKDAQIGRMRDQIYQQILASPQAVTEFIAARPALVLPPECPPAIVLDGETVWETGTVIRVEDGDTVDVQTCRGQLNVRQIGIQAPETVKSTHFAQCGGVEASKFMKSLLPVGTEVQLRSNSYASSNNYEALARPYRYIFAKDAQGEFTIDVQAKLLEAGLAMWFPNESEYIRNQKYLELLNDSAAKRLGLWSGSLCKNESDSTQLGAIELWAETDSPLPNENPFGEYAVLRNTTNRDINLSNWSIRDTSLELFDSRYAIPTGTTLKANGILTIYLGEPLPTFPITQDEIALGLKKPTLQNPSSSSGKYTGDGLYLQTPLLANGGGNMRAWMHRPCLPTECEKPEWLTKNFDGSSRAIPLPTTLSIALNPVKFGRVVPDMTGLTEEQARSALTPLSLNVLIVDRSTVAPGESGMGKSVVDQSPKPGANLPPNATVTVYIDVKR